jgi:hypothetical protein
MWNHGNDVVAQYLRSAGEAEKKASSAEFVGEFWLGEGGEAVI